MLALPASGCHSCLPPDDPPIDLRSRDMRDASAPRDLPTTPVDGSVDQAPVDLAHDLPVPPDDLPLVLDLPPPLPDLSVTMDVAAWDLSGPCHSGYLNSDAGNACPVSCDPKVESVFDEGANHITYGTPWSSYLHNPPASGPHWPFTAPWGKHDEVLRREWWVHNLEHGGVVLLYNCPAPDAGPYNPDGGQPPNDCPQIIAALLQIYANHPQDNWWDALFQTRIIITPDPYLPGKVGAVAWDWSYVSNTLDVNALTCFTNARYGRGPENAP